MRERLARPACRARRCSRAESCVLIGAAESRPRRGRRGRRASTLPARARHPQACVGPAGEHRHRPADRPRGAALGGPEQGAGDCGVGVGIAACANSADQRLDRVRGGGKVEERVAERSAPSPSDAGNRAEARRRRPGPALPGPSRRPADGGRRGPCRLASPRGRPPRCRRRSPRRRRHKLRRRRGEDGSAPNQPWRRRPQPPRCRPRCRLARHASMSRWTGWRGRRLRGRPRLSPPGRAPRHPALARSWNRSRTGRR